MGGARSPPSSPLLPRCGEGTTHPPDMPHGMQAQRTPLTQTLPDRHAWIARPGPRRPACYKS
eukprot:scaffold12441_cov29-Tisochrysis_lutea.AAC.4